MCVFRARCAPVLVIVRQYPQGTKRARCDDVVAECLNTAAAVKVQSKWRLRTRRLHRKRVTAGRKSMDQVLTRYACMPTSTCEGVCGTSQCPPLYWRPLTVRAENVPRVETRRKSRTCMLLVILIRRGSGAFCARCASVLDDRLMGRTKPKRARCGHEVAECSNAAAHVSLEK